MKILAEGLNFYASETGESKGKLLLSLEGYGENLSKLPVAKEGVYNMGSIFGVLSKLSEAVDAYGSMAKIPKNSPRLTCILEIAGSLIKHFCQKHRAYSILEIAQEQSNLNLYLTSTAKAFNEENTVHCISGNMLSQGWLAILQESCFDFCVINANQAFDNPGYVMNCAIRILKSGGVLIFVSEDGKVIEQKITLKEKQAAYEQTNEANIDLQKDELKILMQSAQERLAKIEDLEKEELCRLIKDLAYLEKLAAKLFAEIEDINLKGKLNTAKENVLNVLYAPNEELKKTFMAASRLAELAAVQTHQNFVTIP
ncbi:MAG: hypothetical protein LBH25_06220 [Fibromonadaceae bacterium]|jgi:hypothetical protein|nr:hypothetical protein [Fibromonadaceae bacterium]